MPGLVPGIHVLARGTKARGWPGRRREAKLIALPGDDEPRPADHTRWF
jgi:hypothetical protein